MDNGDVDMVYAKKNIPASDVLVSNKSPAKYKIGVKTQGSIDMSNVKDKTDDQSDSKRKDLNNTRSETEDQLNSKT
ncbi:hypothetical protein EJD97_000366 [Solanum chilense]|uniref:Uncharacterized protein n=1 Tax=Solanum chilense TaxID=4083 RepID=A0A6N2C0L1_SOLCI|nr:hypothetical protein EJD97_000366 [Solanum chilense]